MELVSICIPVFNGEKYLDECLESCLDQTYKNIEIVVVNDGSTDKTHEILKKYPIKVITTENRGEGNARNTAFENSKGKYIAIMDSDDIMYPDRIENSVRGIVGADVVYSGYLAVNEFGIPQYYYDPPEFNKFNFIQNQVIPNPTIMLRRSKYVPYRDFKFSPDFAFIWDMVKRGNRFKCLKDYFIQYRVNPYSLTGTTNQSVKDKYKEIIVKEMEDSESIWANQKR